MNERPYVLINMVASLDGKVTTGGKAGSIGSSVDRRVMRFLRSMADAVMIGAGTIRAEKMSLAVPEDLARMRVSRGLKTQPLAVIATGTGDVPLEENLIGASPSNVLVLSSTEISVARLATLSSRASVEAVPYDQSHRGSLLDLSYALEILKGRYAVDVLLVEGGPALNYALVEKGLADELFLTISPKLLGREVGLETLGILDGPPLDAAVEPELVTLHLSVNDELFLRYVL